MDKRVISADVRFSLDLYKDPKVGSRFASNFADVDSVSTPDSLTAVAWFAKSLAGAVLQPRVQR